MTYNGTKAQGTSDPRIRYAADHSLRLHPAQQKLIQLTSRCDDSEMLGSADEIQLLQNLCRAICAKKTLDIGVYTGYSAMSIAMALPDDGTVVACDVSDKYPRVGMPVWKEAGVDHKIQLKIGPASGTLQRLIDNGESGTFDFAFIDADKENYSVYYELCLQLLRRNGIIALDNMLWYGAVYDPAEHSSETVALRAMADMIQRDERVNISFLTVGDGTMLAFKK